MVEYSPKIFDSEDKATTTTTTETPPKIHPLCTFGRVYVPNLLACQMELPWAIQVCVVSLVCTFGRVYVPCIYSLARWSYRRRFRALL